MLSPKTDNYLFVIVTLLSLIGVATIYSVTHNNHLAAMYLKQLSWLGIGLGVAWTVSHISPKYLYNISYPLYLLLIVALIAVSLFGTVKLGAKRWIFGVQPSEVGKLILVLCFAKYFSQNVVNWRDKQFLGRGLLLFVVPFFLVFSQPDLGSSLIYLVLFMSIMVARGLPYYYLINIGMPILFIIAGSLGMQWLVSLFLLYFYFVYKFGKSKGVSLILLTSNLLVGMSTGVVWGVLKGYQKQRILTFVNPEAYAQSGAWQIIQSKIAIGNGGLLGEGFMKGSQTQLKFLPEGQTDFVFSVIAEEWGFVGVLVTLILFVMLIYRIVKISNMLYNRFYYLVTLGILSIIVFQLFINVGMTTGLMPVTGKPLPFLSYGGSSMFLNMLMIGIVAAIYRFRRDY